MENEVFQQKYELDILAGIVTRGQLERWVPGFCNPNTDKEHRQRYQWASQFVVGKSVLDIACGVGAGTKTFALAGATKVIGADLDQNTIRYAQIKNQMPTVTFLVADAQQFKFDEQFDVVVSFETVEHLKDVDGYLSLISASLNSQGHFIVSTPICRKNHNIKPANIYHFQEWGLNSFQKMISRYFEIEETYLQMYPPRIRWWQKIMFKIRQIKFNTELMIVNLNEIKLSRRLIKKYSNGYQILICRKKI